jgi:hypothetical protein
VSTNLTTIVILVTVIHVAAFVVMIWIRFRRCEADDTPGESARVDITPCAVCGDPATHRNYDGLDPDEQYDPRTGRYWSADIAHYPPRCAAH